MRGGFHGRAAVTGVQDDLSLGATLRPPIEVRYRYAWLETARHDLLIDSYDGISARSGMIAWPLEATEVT